MNTAENEKQAEILEDEEEFEEDVEMSEDVQVAPASSRHVNISII